MIKTPTKTHGGKAYLASKIVQYFPPHQNYVEPYAGGLSVLLRKNPDNISEVVNDIDQALTNFWATMRDEAKFKQFQRLVEATNFSERTWKQATQIIDEATEYTTVGHAWAFFVNCRLSLAGRLDSFAPITKNRLRRRMNEQVSAWLSAIEGLAEVHARLKRVVVLDHQHAPDVIRTFDMPHTLFYLDPPYYHPTRTAIDVYKHEMTKEQHEELLGTIKTVKAKVMISGYESDLYNDALTGWDKRVFECPNNAAGGLEKRRMFEVIWANYDLERALEMNGNTKNDLSRCENGV